MTKSSLILILVVIMMFVPLSGALAANRIFERTFDSARSFQEPLGSVVTVTAPDISTSTGSTITISLMASDTTGLSITGYNARFLFDSSVIAPVDSAAGCSVAGTLFAGSVAICNIFPTANELTVQIFSLANPVAGAGPILNVSFQVVGSPGDVSPFNAEGFFFNEGDPASNFINGSVAVLSPTAAGVTLQGRILTHDGQPISGAIVLAYDDLGRAVSARANVFGQFRFTGLRGGHPYIISAKAKEHSFPSEILTLNEQVTVFNVIAEGASRNQRR